MDFYEQIENVHGQVDENEVYFCQCTFFLITFSLSLCVVVMAPQLNTTSPNNASIVVTWPPVENAVLYMLCIIQEGSSSRVKLNTTDTTVNFNDLAAGTTYCIKGTAWDSEGRAGDDLTVCQITRKLDKNIRRA